MEQIPEPNLGVGIRKISASLLAADFRRLVDSIHKAEDAGVDSFHIDIVDGHFAKNFSFGPDAVIAVRESTKLPLSVHLEIDCPDEFLEVFIRAGADTIFFHKETSKDPLQAIEYILRLGRRPGLALVPSASFSHINNLVRLISSILVLGVPPGFGGATLNPNTVNKIRKLNDIKKNSSNSFEIVVDGGINLNNIAELAAVGVDTFVIGTYLFTGNNIRNRVALLREKIETAARK